jgi:hypothetical protein
MLDAASRLSVALEGRGEASDGTGPVTVGTGYSF